MEHLHPLNMRKLLLDSLMKRTLDISCICRFTGTICMCFVVTQPGFESANSRTRNGRATTVLHVSMSKDEGLFFTVLSLDCYVIIWVVSIHTNLTCILLSELEWSLTMQMYTNFSVKHRRKSVVVTNVTPKVKPRYQIAPIPSSSFGQ